RKKQIVTEPVAPPAKIRRKKCTVFSLRSLPIGLRCSDIRRVMPKRSNDDSPRERFTDQFIPLRSLLRRQYIQNVFDCVLSDRRSGHLEPQEPAIPERTIPERVSRSSPSGAIRRWPAKSRSIVAASAWTLHSSWEGRRSPSSRTAFIVAATRTGLL